MATPRTMQKKRYNDEHYDTITFTVPKGAKDAFKRRLSEKGESMGGALKRYVLASIKTESAKGRPGCEECKVLRLDLAIATGEYGNSRKKIAVLVSEIERLQK